MKKLKAKIKDKLGEKNTAKLKKAVNIVRIIKNIVCWTLIAVLTVSIVIFMITKFTGGTPEVFGYSIHRIVSGSMEPELQIGDVIINKEIKDASEVHIGDIITFQGDKRFENQKVTHRVLVAPYDNGRGTLVLVTKGDANETDDGDINFSDVESKCLTKLTFLNSVYGFFFSPIGLIVFIFLLFLIFFDEILNIIRISVNGAKQEESESFQEIVERIKREKLEEMKRNQEMKGSSQQDDSADEQSSIQDEPKEIPDTVNTDAENKKTKDKKESVKKTVQTKKAKKQKPSEKKNQNASSDKKQSARKKNKSNQVEKKKSKSSKSQSGHNGKKKSNKKKSKKKKKR